MSARTRIKICGVSRPEDVAAAVDAGADAIGLVFHPGSPRHVTLTQATALALALPPYVTPVGLFVNADAAKLAAAVAAIPTLVLQFHGDETPAQCAAAGRPFLKAARMAPGLDLLNFSRRFSGAQGLLLDAHVEAFGGSGKVFDWSLVPRGVPHRLVLSGGLHAGNVGSGIREIRPWAVDVSSGVESTRGVKDAAAIHAFCDAVREADLRIEASVS
ncbi:MAG: phosphoribosylanthranilate isomerase [Burkholderiales bacterium]|nr:phosphoribosylanthranilate isomerase [Burkholderiales bacterium]